MLIKECPQEPIPCKQCPVLAICRSKPKHEKIRCNILYKHYRNEVGFKEKINTKLLFKYTHFLNHIDWTISKPSKEIWIWTHEHDEMKGELGETLWKQ